MKTVFVITAMVTVGVILTFIATTYIPASICANRLRTLNLHTEERAYLCGHSVFAEEVKKLYFLHIKQESNKLSQQEIYMATTKFHPCDLKPLVGIAAMNMVIAAEKGNSPEAKDTEKIKDILTLCTNTDYLITLTAEEYVLIKHWAEKDKK